MIKPNKQNPSRRVSLKQKKAQFLMVINTLPVFAAPTNLGRLCHSEARIRHACKASWKINIDIIK